MVAIISNSDILEDILDTITSHYLSSGDFNGMPFWSLAQLTGIDCKALKTTLFDLVSSGLISFLDETMDSNPAIIRYGFLTQQEQIDILKRSPINERIFLYPTEKQLANVVRAEDYSDVPYRLVLAYGEAQLKHKYFDLTVLEMYRNDPRYSYYCDDFSGHICSSNEQMNDKEKKCIQNFGFAYGDKRALALSLLRSEYLHDDQQIDSFLRIKVLACDPI